MSMRRADFAQLLIRATKWLCAAGPALRRSRAGGNGRPKVRCLSAIIALQAKSDGGAFATQRGSNGECMALFGIVERLSAAGMGAALEEAARGFEVFGELAEIGRVVLVAARALDGRAASLLGWRLAAERGARARHHALHGATSEVWTPPAPGAGIRGVRM